MRQHATGTLVHPQKSASQVPSAIFKWLKLEFFLLDDDIFFFPLFIYMRARYKVYARLLHEYIEGNINFVKGYENSMILALHTFEKHFKKRVSDELTE